MSSFNSAWLQANGFGQTPTLGLLAREFSNTLLGLVARPLLGVYHPGIPYFDPLSGTFFLAGLALGFRDLDKPQYAIIPVVLLAIGLTGAFSLGAPCSQRLVIAAPILAVRTALSADRALKWARATRPRLRSRDGGPAGSRHVPGLLLLRQRHATRPLFRGSGACRHRVRALPPALPRRNPALLH